MCTTVSATANTSYLKLIIEKAYTVMSLIVEMGHFTPGERI